VSDTCRARHYNLFRQRERPSDYAHLVANKLTRLIDASDEGPARDAAGHDPIV